MSLKFFPKGATGDNSLLVQLMDWYNIHNKPLTEPMMADAYTSMGHNGLILGQVSCITVNKNPES